MNDRKRFFALLEGEPVDRLPFFPDISTWYEYTRLSPGEAQIYGPGAYIPDDSPIHQRPSRLGEAYQKKTFVDWYKEQGWGLPVHMSGWYTTRYDGGVEVQERREGRMRYLTFKTPKGDLTRSWQLASDGSWAPITHLCASVEDLEIVKCICAHTVFAPNYGVIERFQKDTEGFGVCDLPISRSPFGKLVHEYLGFAETVYAFFDEPAYMEGFLEVQAEIDMRLIRLAAESPAHVVIISDHADENLISPPDYQKYCMPFYREAAGLLNRAGKYVSTHLDGNFHGYLPFIARAGFNLLDGCTPSPMFNYTHEELAAATKGGPLCYCGVPSSLFTQGLPTRELVDFGVSIARAFDRRVLINVGDILPQNGDVEQVVAVGQAVMAYGTRPSRAAR